MKKIILVFAFTGLFANNTFDFLKAYTQITQDSILAYKCVKELKETAQGDRGNCQNFSRKINLESYDSLLKLNINNFDFSGFKILKRNDIDKNATKQALFSVFIQKAKANLELNNLLNKINAVSINY